MDDDELSPAGPTNAAWLADQRKWARGWRRTLLPSVFLAYLLQVVGGISQDSHGAAAVAGYAVFAGFCACYLAAFHLGWSDQPRRFPMLEVALVALFVAELPFARANASVMGVFIVIVMVRNLGARAAPIVAALTLAAIVVPAAVPSWHDSLATGFQNGTAIAIPLTGLSMYGFSRVIRGNRALAEARTEIARLAAENERARIARDLHDLLGHSLTAITVKAELAGRLGRHDIDGARREIGEVEALSRRTLRDVRAAVANYREVTLAGELATGRELLRAAGIAAQLPPAVEIVDDKTQELFGWVLREGLTNVVRHSRASWCRVRVSSSSVEIVDDGVGVPSGSGSGLAGLAERVASTGGVIEAGPASPKGWRLAVRLSGAAPT
jgi:two-component system, NarL family, sensor histidine kinase DesK